MDPKYQSIFAQIKAEHKNAPLYIKRDRDSDILLIDGTLNFIRNWSVVPTMNDNGEHVGGVSGFLLSIGYAIKLLHPTRVIIIFDGKGGSLRRKKIFPEYKDKSANRFRVNRTYAEMSTPEKEEEVMLVEMGILIEFLRSLPVTVMAIDYIEADDAIAYICTQLFEKSRITIMSADKDYMQLVNDHVSIWSPVKKKIYGVQDVINEYGVHPTNFVYYRILDGDPSDKIPGVKGIALKTAIKLFPMLVDPTEYSVEAMLKFSKDKINENKLYTRILDESEIVARNYQLMQLKTPNFSGIIQLKIQQAVEQLYELNKFRFILSLTAHCMHTTIPNYHVWLQEVFQPLANLAALANRKESVPAEENKQRDVITS
jgi:DNA polymerase-1